MAMLSYGCFSCCCFCYVKNKSTRGAGYKIGIQDALCLLPLSITIVVIYGIVGIPSRCSAKLIYFSVEKAYQTMDKRSLNITDCGGYSSLVPENPNSLGTGWDT